MKSWRQFLVFALIGGVNTLIHYAVFLAAYRLAGLPMLLGSALGYACGLANSYVLNRRWTFRVARRPGAGEFVRFSLVNAAALAANLLLLDGLVARAGMRPELAQAIAIGGSLAVNFAGHKWWTFRASGAGFASATDLEPEAAPARWWSYLLVAALVAPLFFVGLGSFPLRLWDESRLAVNALEMFHDGDWIVTHFNGQPDHWNTKPPLLIWIQVAAMRLFGPSDLAARLPSAVAALSTCLMLLAFARRTLADTGFGVVAALALATSPGFAGLHAGRTADYDALLTLLVTGANLAFFLYLEEGRRRHLYACGAAMTLGILTKGVGAVLFVPALVIYALVRRRFVALLRDRHVYASMAILTAFVAGYYLLRAHHDPGYLAKVGANELGGRYLRTIEGHDHPALFYFSFLWRERLPHLWIALVPCGLAAGGLGRRTVRGRLVGFAALLAAAYLVTISASRTKLLWYDVPAYPLLAVLVAAGLCGFRDGLLRLLPPASRPVRQVAVVLLCGVVLAWPYRDGLRRAVRPENEPNRYRLGYVLKDALDGRRDLDGVGLLIEGYAPHNDFYIRLLQDRGVAVARRDWRRLETGERILTADDALRDSVAVRYECADVVVEPGVTSCEIRGPSGAASGP